MKNAGREAPIADASQALEEQAGQASKTTAPVGRRSRRRFLKRALWTAAAVGAGLGAYSALEASWLRVVKETIETPRVAAPFVGMRIAFLTDLHHGPFTGIEYIERVVARTNALAPDLILLGGDYIHRGPQFIYPCANALGKLKAPLGVYAVLGNHDHWHGGRLTSACLEGNGIVELKNRGVWLRKGGARLRLGGVDDLWTARQDLGAALGDATDDDACLLLSHNPDTVESIDDQRVSLVLSGHTHGGQVVLPVVGAPIVPSQYGQKYLRGLVETEATKVYVSRGLGTVTPPLRFCCPPEINLITLAGAVGPDRAGAKG